MDKRDEMIEVAADFCARCVDPPESWNSTRIIESMADYALNRIAPLEAENAELKVALAGSVDSVTKLVLENGDLLIKNAGLKTRLATAEMLLEATTEIQLLHFVNEDDFEEYTIFQDCPGRCLVYRGHETDDRDPVLERETFLEAFAALQTGDKR